MILTFALPEPHQKARVERTVDGEWDVYHKGFFVGHLSESPSTQSIIQLIEDRQ